jgi:hypothetical protein
VRRVARPRDAGVPEELCRFVPSEWPGGCVHEQLEAWKDAAAGWLAADTTRQPRPGADPESGRWWLAGGSRRRLPFGESGGAVDLLREAERLGRQLRPCPHEDRPAQYRGPSGC